MVQKGYVVNTNKNELNDLIINKNIINYITAQRLSWFGRVDRTTNDRMVKKIIWVEQISTGLAGRPK
jgi:hypothetical protein